MGSSGAVSLKPIMTSPTSAPRPSTMAFVASVVERAAILIRAGSIACAAAPNPEAGSCPSSPTFSNKLPRHESMARVRSCLVVKILLLARISFRSRSKRTPSVKVPPVSMPRARLVIYAASSFTTCFVIITGSSRGICISSISPAGKSGQAGPCFAKPAGCNSEFLSRNLTIMEE